MRVSKKYQLYIRIEGIRNQIDNYLKTQGFSRNLFLQNANDEEIGEHDINKNGKENAQDGDGKENGLRGDLEKKARFYNTSLQILN